MFSRKTIRFRFINVHTFVRKNNPVGQNVDIETVIKFLKCLSIPFVICVEYGQTNKNCLAAWTKGLQEAFKRPALYGPTILYRPTYNKENIEPPPHLHNRIYLIYILTVWHGTADACNLVLYTIYIIWWEPVLVMHSLNRDFKPLAAYVCTRVGWFMPFVEKYVLFWNQE